MPRRVERTARGHAAPAAPDDPSARAGIPPALNAGLRAGSHRVQEMHQAIAGKTFRALERVPLIAAPAALVEAVHDTITKGVYGAVRHGGSALLSLAGRADALAARSPQQASRSEMAWRGALSGVFGDSLHAAGNPLALTMGFHAHGRVLALAPESLRGLKPHVAVFIHGLACDERSWQRRPEVWDGAAHADGLGRSYGERLENELGLSAIYLRYNSGLAVEDNAREFARQLACLLDAAPQVRELSLVGHSMGGLIARSACGHAKDADHAWLKRVRVLVCIGTPHQGAPLEKLGQLATLALGLSRVTQPLKQIAEARSRGIKDLRHGLPAEEPALDIPLRLIAGSLSGKHANSTGLAGAMFGDGLVMPGSASDRARSGDVQRVELRGLGHMTLLNHPRVYAVLRPWLQAAGTC
ncbi:MAG TPA: hypothetical protein VGE16_16135 [Albitalea sp.]